MRIVENQYKDICELARGKYLSLNNRLDNQVALTRLNETFIENCLEELQTIFDQPNRFYVLTLARLVELTLFCAFGYAKNGYAQAAGDLLFHPRLIHVYIKDSPDPVRKERYIPLTVQFQDMASTHAEVVEWLKFNTVTQIVEKPVLYRLLDLLEENDCSSDYLASITERTTRISQIISEHAVLEISNCIDLGRCGDLADEPDLMFFERLCCGFDLKRFKHLGKHIQSLEHPRSTVLL